MTRYTVNWDPDLEQAFIDLWVDSDSETRSSLTKIANWIDANLALDPDTKGLEHSEPDLDAARIVVVPIAAPHVSVTYQVKQEDRLVRVIRLIIR